MQKAKITISDLNMMKKSADRITVLTAYDYPTACALDKNAIDIILVGDSLGNVVLGYDDTIPVSIEEMLHHTKAVRRGTKRAFLVADMPFMSYNINSEESIRNAGKLIKHAGADAVKIEGAKAKTLKMIKAIIGAGISVMGHIGLTPQTATMLGGYKVQGKTRQAAAQLMQQAKALEKAGVFAIVFECIPDALAELITRKLKIPTIGIGAGSGCDGQVLVTNDMLGMNDRFTPKFVKKYAKLSKGIDKAINDYVKEVKEKKFPSTEQSFSIKKQELKGL